MKDFSLMAELRLALDDIDILLSTLLLEQSISTSSYADAVMFNKDVIIDELSITLIEEEKKLTGTELRFLIKEKEEAINNALKNKQYRYIILHTHI